VVNLLDAPSTFNHSEAGDLPLQLDSGRSKDVLASFHIRGGPSFNQSIGSSNSNINTLRSSGGWMTSTLDETEKAEEELKRELKKAKVRKSMYRGVCC